MKSGDLTPDILEQILHDMASGCSLRSACASVGCSHVAFLRRVRTDKELEKKYVEAMEIRADGIFDELLEISDDGRNDYMEVLDKHGELKGYRENREFTGRSKLRVSTRQWMLSMLSPQKYGAKQTVDLNANVNVEGALAEGRLRAMNREKPED